jgi:Fe-S-cluster containining protein
MTNRSFDDDPREIKRLMEYHGIQPIKNSKGELGIHIPGDCKHLLKDSDWKYGCAIYETRPIVCREYCCEKIIKKALETIADGVHI